MHILAGMYRSKGESNRSLWDDQSGRLVFRATMSYKRFQMISEASDSMTNSPVLLTTQRTSFLLSGICGRSGHSTSVLMSSSYPSEAAEFLTEHAQQASKDQAEHLGHSRRCQIICLEVPGMYWKIHWYNRCKVCDCLLLLLYERILDLVYLFSLISCVCLR